MAEVTCFCGGGRGGYFMNSNPMERMAVLLKSMNRISFLYQIWMNHLTTKWFVIFRLVWPTRRWKEGKKLDTWAAEGSRSIETVGASQFGTNLSFFCPVFLGRFRQSLTNTIDIDMLKVPQKSTRKEGGWLGLIVGHCKFSLFFTEKKKQEAKDGQNRKVKLAGDLTGQLTVGRDNTRSPWSTGTSVESNWASWNCRLTHSTLKGENFSRN